jgi:hypothetical protein
MDIEGSERKALAGAREVLRKFRPRMALRTYHLPDDVVVVPATVKSMVADYEFVCGPCGEVDASFRKPYCSAKGPPSSGRVAHLTA